MFIFLLRAIKTIIKQTLDRNKLIFDFLFRAMKQTLGKRELNFLVDKSKELQ